MERKREIVLLVVIISFEYATAAIIVKPSNTEVTVGSSTFLNCSTSFAKYVNWYYYPTGSQISSTTYVYYYGQLFGNYKDRFQLYKNESSGSYDIFIPKVELSDAGVYACQDDEGNGETVSAELIVLEGSPTCSSTMKPDGVVGVNSCKVEPEMLELSCGVSYRGKSPPSLQWRKVEGNTSITQGVTTEAAENRITSRLTMTSEPSVDGSSFVCETSNAHYHCISSTIRIIYAIGLSGNAVPQQAKMGDTVLCKANASQVCRYKWKWFKGEDTLTSSNNQTLIPRQSGDFRCEAECFIRNQPCMLTAMLVQVEGDNTTSTGELTASSLTPGYVALIVCIVIAIIAIIVVVVFLIYRRSRIKGLSSPSTPIVNGDIPKQESERLLQSFEKKTDANDFSKLITLLPYLDKGSSGEVYGPCQFKGKTCAFQRILYSTSKLSAEKDKVEREIDDRGNRWLELEHENVIKLYSVRFEAPALYIMLEYADGGTVRKALDLCKEELPSDVIANWALQIASGMEYLHDKDIVHTHLKSAQILIMEPFDPSDVSKKKTLKIASYRISTDGIQSVPSFKGMFAWESPESIQMKTFSKPRDIWSYGVTVWEILTRSIPHTGTKHAAIIEKVMAGNKGLAIPTTCPNFLHNIMMDCWTIEPDKRPSFSDIVSTLKDPKQNLISISDGNAIPEALVRLPYMDKGSSGEVFGPFLFQRSKCACERFMYSPTKVACVSEDEICRQGKRWMELHHINVLRFYDVLFVNPTLYVVMDYAEGESVRKTLNSCTEDMEISLVKDWATQIAEGMSYLHSREIVHGRLKSAKVLIMFKEDDSSKKTLKIGPFGLATDSHSVPVSFKGMFAWMAPESIQGSEHTCKASDVWSYGVTVWEILTRSIPYQGIKQAAIIKNIFDGNPTLPIPQRCPGAIRDILKECWSQDIHKRPTFSDILSRLRASADS